MLFAHIKNLPTEIVVSGFLRRDGGIKPGSVRVDGRAITSQVDFYCFFASGEKVVDEKIELVGHNHCSS